MNTVALSPIPIPAITGADVPASEVMVYVERELMDLVAMIARRGLLTKSERLELVDLAMIAGFAGERAMRMEEAARAPTRREREGWTWRGRIGWCLLQQMKGR